MGDDGVHGDVESVGYLIVLESFGQTDEHLLLAVGKGVGVGFVIIGLERVLHLVEGGLYPLRVVIQLDDSGELLLMLRFDVRGDKPDEPHVGQLVELRTEGCAAGILKEQRIENQDIRFKSVDPGVQSAEIVGGEHHLHVGKLAQQLGETDTQDRRGFGDGDFSHGSAIQGIGYTAARYGPPSWHVSRYRGKGHTCREAYRCAHRRRHPKGYT